MHDTARFRSRESACGLLNYIQSHGERHWSIAPYTRFKRFAFDEFHSIETLAVLFSIINHASNIRMMNVRSCSRLAQKTRTCVGISRHFPVDDLEGYNRVQHCVVCTVGDGHRSRTELNRKAIRSRLYFEVGVSQWPRCQPSTRRRFFRVLAVRQKTKANETTQAFPVRTALGQRTSACSARPRSFSLRSGGSDANADVVHA